MSRFVSAGAGESSKPRDEDWKNAQEDVEARKTSKQSQSLPDSGKSLYDTLQANKAAKQEAFEEAARLKNQFRPLDDEEVEFLDSVRETSRAKEAAVKQETAEQLETFRKQREAAEQAKVEDDNTSKSETWTTKKRPRKTKEDQSSKIRKLSSSEENHQVVSTSPAQDTMEATNALKGPNPASTKSSSKPQSANLGLGAYSSEED